MGRTALRRFFFLAAVLCLLLPYATNSLHANDLPPARIFTLEREGVSPSWLFGTMHSSDPDVLELPPEVRVALGRSRLVVLEVDITRADLGELYAAMLLPDGQTLADVLTPELFARAMEAFEILGMSGELGMRFKPWAAALMLSFDEAELKRRGEGEESLDEVLGHYAQKHDKEVLGLESVQEQLAYFEELPPDWQIEFLETVLDHPELAGAGVEEMEKYYLSGDHAGLWNYYSELAARYDTPFQRHFTQTLIIARNHLMAERLGPILNGGGAFVAVGELHLGGPEGLLVLLQAEGYVVSPLP